MSKNKKPVAVTKTESAETPVKKKKTAVIISAAAIFLVVCILLGIFVVKPAIDKNKETTANPSTSSSSGLEGIQMSDYTYVDYKGAQVAEPLAEILRQAELDSASACQKYGVAMTLGDRDISRSEFHLYYLDQYRTQMTAVQYSIEKAGANRTGYDTSVLPDAQKHPTKDITWAEQFVFEAADKIKLNYLGFDMAIKENVQLDESEIADLIMSYSRAINYAKQNQKETDEYIAGVYTDGLTYSMFAAREIIAAYASKYEYAKQLEYHESYSEETIAQKLEESNDKYKIIKARVYPIEGTYDAVEASKVRTEKEFLDYANQNYPGEGYNAEVITQCFYTSKDTIAKTFGDEVAEWMFSEDRVRGETQVIEGQLFYYMCHIIELPYYSTSCHIMSYEVDHNEAFDDARKQEEVKNVEKMLENWKNGDATPESFAEIAAMSSYTPERDVRSGEYSFEINNWLFDKARKPGDTEVFSDEYGIYMFYYVQNNEDDYDWNRYLRGDLAQQDYEKYYEQISGDNTYDVETKSSVITRIIKAANVRITNQINESNKQK